MTTLEQPKAREPEIIKPESGPVQVNQCALIRKILSRYSSEFSVFRELLQNSDDAGSDNVDIRFETASGTTNSKCIVQNSGHPFKKEDWDRLMVIADGNPHSGKVGAFGVGFYAIFSLTDHPGIPVVVLSGGRKMEFHWEVGQPGQPGQLCYRLSEHHTPDKGTTIEMSLKNDIPERDDLFQFLATSITFMTHLKNVEVFLNEVSIGRISAVTRIEKIKDNGPPIKMEPVSPSNVRFLEPLQLQHRRFTIEYFPDPKKQPNKSSTLGLSKYSIVAGVEMDPKLEDELFQCTFKHRAPEVKYSLIYTGKDDYDKSSAHMEHRQIFQELRADLDEASHSKIFIGHSTRQTTGIGGHMESQFLSTVERESIDLVDNDVATWNNSLLYLGSFLSRVVYELELSGIETTWIKLSEASEAPDFAPLHEHFIHVLRFFTFRTSTPSPKIAEKLCASFYTCSTSPLRLLSSVGVRQVSDIRLYNNLCEKFLKDVPMLSLGFNDLAANFVKAQQQEIQCIKFTDVKNDLQKHALRDPKELVACLQWILDPGWTRQPGAGVRDLLKVVRFQDANETVELSSIKHFINPRKDGTYIPLDGPLPRSVLPHQITQSFDPIMELQKFGWREFTVVDWIPHISSQAIRSDDEGRYDFTRSPDWAERVLHCISSAWSSASGGDLLKRLGAVDVFKTEKCIPTTHGLCTPEESCLPNLNITKSNGLDFPTVQLPSGREISDEMKKLLIVLGVRKTPPIGLILKHLRETRKLETSALIDYLVHISSILSDSDIEVLKSLSIFAQKGNREDDDGETSYWRANQLYPPTEIFQKLGLPLIDWGESTEWQDVSRKEVELLYRLDLNRVPPLEKIIELSQKNTEVGEVAFEYLCNNLRTNYHNFTFMDFQDTAFVPMESSSLRDGVGRGRLGDVFLDKQWKEFGFPVVPHRYKNGAVEDLEIQRHPPPSLILQRLKEFTENRSSSEDTARRWFSILSDHVSKFEEDELCLIGGLNIVPVFTRKGEKVMLTPVECYLRQPESAEHNLYPKLFHFVDFGIAGQKFLRACGAKIAPTKEDIAQKLISDPNEFYKLAGGHIQFLEELRFLASKNPTSASNAIVENMKSQPVLLGIIKKPKGDSYVLRKPREIVIVHDERTFQPFANSIAAAPRNISRELEDFYMLLGCQPLTTAIRDQPRPFGEIEDPNTCDLYRNLVLERLPIFLSSCNYPRPKPETPAARFSGANALTVRIWQKLSVSKILTVAKNTISTEERPISAITQIDGQNTIQLWLTYHVKEDRHDLAVSLCRAFIGTEHPSDIEFLTTCLSVGPDISDMLERRQYKVNWQHLSDWRLPRPADTSTEITQVRLSVNDLTGQVGSRTEGDLDSTTARMQSTTNQSCLLRGTGHTPRSRTASPMPFPFQASAQIAKGKEETSCEVHKTRSGTLTPIFRQSPDLVMHQQHIESTIGAAIQACGSGQLNTPLMRHMDLKVDKFPNSHCGVSALVDDLRFLSRVRDVAVYVAQDFPNINANSTWEPKPLSCFLDIVRHVATVYGLSTKSYCIFYHATAGCIAFNHKGTIYLNLQYFEKWHYKDVSDGKQRQALALWFLTFAHEIAHNLISEHNSEHEFWFLVICEKYMDSFSSCLASVTS